MQRFFLCLGCLLTAFSLSGAVPGAWKSVKGELNIADTIPGGDEAVKKLILQVGLDNVNLAVNLSRMSVNEAVKSLESGKIDIILGYEDLLPERLKMRRRYAAEAAVAAVNVRNSRKDFTVEELCSIFSGNTDSWQSLNGGSFSIHRMGVPDHEAGAEIFKRKVMKERPLDKNLYRKSAGQLLILTGVNANAIAFMGWTDHKPTMTVREVSVNGISPTEENIKSGKYPLTAFRTAVMGKKISPQTRMFLQMLKSREFVLILREQMLLAP